MTISKYIEAIGIKGSVHAASTFSIENIKIHADPGENRHHNVCTKILKVDH